MNRIHRLCLVLAIFMAVLFSVVEGRRHRGAAPAPAPPAVNETAGGATNDTTTPVAPEDQAAQQQQQQLRGNGGGGGGGGAAAAAPKNNQTQQAATPPKGGNATNAQHQQPPPKQQPQQQQPPKKNNATAAAQPPNNNNNNNSTQQQQQKPVPPKGGGGNNDNNTNNKPQPPKNNNNQTQQKPNPPKGNNNQQPPKQNATSTAVKKVGRIDVPHSDVTLSRIAYGSLHFPEFNDDVAGLKASIDKCLEMGITTMDLSDVYGWYQDGHGRANDIFSKVLKANPGLRPKLELVAKFGIRLNGGYHVDLSPGWIQESIDRYLDLFDTDHVDVFMIHNPDPNMDYKGIAKAFKEISVAKKAKAFGISNFHEWEYISLKEAMADEGLKLSVHEMETSVLHPEKISDGTVDFFSKGEDEMRILGWGPLGGEPNGGKNLLFGSDGEREKRIVGALTEKGKTLALSEVGVDGKASLTTFQPDEVAVAWLLHHPSNIVPIIGTTTVQRIMSQSVPAEKIPFQDKDWNDIMDQLHY